MPGSSTEPPLTFQSEFHWWMGTSLFKSRVLAGKVIIANGWVRVYKPTQLGEDDPLFEAQYYEFEQVLVENETEIDDMADFAWEVPSVFLVGTRKIALFKGTSAWCNEFSDTPDHTLNTEDYEMIQRISKETGIRVIWRDWVYDPLKEYLGRRESE